MKKYLLTTVVVITGLTFSAAGVLALVPKKFSDVPSDRWYASSVERIAGRGLMNGYGNGNFGPDDAVTRAQFAAVLNAYDKENELMKTLLCHGVQRNNDLNPFYLTWDKICPMVTNFPGEVTAVNANSLTIKSLGYKIMGYSNLEVKPDKVFTVVYAPVIRYAEPDGSGIGGPIRKPIFRKGMMVDITGILTISSNQIVAHNIIIQ